MTEVFFYHLQRQPLEKVLPVLLEKCRERKWNAVVQAGSDERVSTLDDILWTYTDESFLAHGTAQDATARHQPVFLTSDDSAPNDPAVRVFIDGVQPAALEGLERVMVLFDGNDTEAVMLAREHYKTLREQGHVISYWQQDEGGRWAKN
jgi:DNA polymerase III subunit chi